MHAIRTRTIEANGLTFAIDEAGEGDDVALLLHGFPESRLCWRHQLPALAGLGWRAVAPDLRGYGGSSRPEGRAAYRLSALLQDVAALFDALGAKRRLLIGHDWGGLIAWQAAIERSCRLDGLIVLNAPHPTIFRRRLRHRGLQRLRSLYVLLFQLPILPEWLLAARGAKGTAQLLGLTARTRSAFPPAILDAYQANARIPGAMTAMLNYYRANLWAFALMDGLSPVLLASAAEPIAVPTLLVWGEADVALGVTLTEGTEAFVSDFTLRRLPGVSHWVQEEAPDAVNEIVRAWMTSRGLALPTATIAS